MKIFFDPQRKALVYVRQAAESQYWDEHWEANPRQLRVDKFVQKETSKYLPPGSKVLEGGCGLGEKVYSLKDAGFDAIGIDFAEKTVSHIKKNYPDLNVLVGDVRNLPIGNQTLDGYWSLGVIEHFYDGYDQIAQEMLRTIVPGGYLFLTVPAMSPIRKLKSKLGFYPIYKNSPSTQSQFYQFALDPEKVVSYFRSIGFEYVNSHFLDGFKGLKDEFLNIGFMQKIYNSQNILSRIFRKIINAAFSPATGHICYFVFKKNKA